ncbi:MAG TPA: LytTR family DNA-binding domain-containing protein [Pyrinomonadaceae bacterium]|jgi:two-component system LytT family response regulator|nr:LytTR family DNA-binding domain-containing protein [Pyrinomonadaceae bacterium]
MNKIRAIIADDEPLARRGIRQLLGPHPDIIIVAETRNGRETVRVLRELAPDLLFLDVQMPEMDGFGVLREIGAKAMPAVIFVTAYDEFAVRAFEAHALDYLVKPLEIARFTEALEHMRERLRSAKAVGLSRKLAGLLATRERERLRIVVPTRTGDLVFAADEIDWIEADDYYAAIHARRGRHLIRESLASLEQRLDRDRFVRAHRSAIVNIDRVRELRDERGETILLLHNGVRVPVSRRRRAQVARLMRNQKD